MLFAYTYKEKSVDTPDVTTAMICSRSSLLDSNKRCAAFWIWAPLFRLNHRSPATIQRPTGLARQRLRDLDPRGSKNIASSCSYGLSSICSPVTRACTLSVSAADNTRTLQDCSAILDNGENNYRYHAKLICEALGKENKNGRNFRTRNREPWRKGRKTSRRLIFLAGHNTNFSRRALDWAPRSSLHQNTSCFSFQHFHEFLVPGWPSRAKSS